MREEGREDPSGVPNEEYEADRRGARNEEENGACDLDDTEDVDKVRCHAHTLHHFKLSWIGHGDVLHHSGEEIECGDEDGTRPADDRRE